jgi:hypothetical protein
VVTAVSATVWFNASAIAVFASELSEVDVWVMPSLRKKKGVLAGLKLACCARTNSQIGHDKTYLE